MNAIVKKVTSLLDSDDLELRVAAVRVLAELGVSSKSVTQAIGRCLDEPHDKLRLVALKALARLGANDVAPQVVPLILASGSLREQAMAVVAAMGPAVMPQLARLYAQADYHGKRAILTACSRVGGKESVAFLLRVLPDESFEIQKHLMLCISDALDRMSPVAQAPVINLLLRMVKDRKTAKRPQILVTCAILLGHTRGPALAARARAQLKLLADKKYPPEVRRHAIVSWNRLLAHTKVGPADYQFLFSLMRDDDWHNVVQHALAGLHHLPLGDKYVPRLIELLRVSSHFSVHIRIFEWLQQSNRPDVAEAILPFLGDSRFRVRESAEAALRKMPSAIQSLFELLVKTDDLEVTQRINAILRDFPQETRSKYVDRAVSRLLRLFEANDPHYKSFLEFVKGLGADTLRKRVYQAAHSLKRGKKRDRWERIVGLVRLLWDNHLITPEGRYLLAVGLLRLHAKELSPSARRSSLALRVLRSLIYDNCDDLVKRLRADSDVTAEEYHYLGFHFSEEGEEFQPFAKAMLEHVVKRYPRSRVAADAANKLRHQERRAKEEEDASSKPRAARAKKALQAAKAASGARANAARKGAATKPSPKKPSPKKPSPKKPSPKKPSPKKPAAKKPPKKSSPKTPKKPAKKPKKKPAARKSAARKPAGKKPASKKPSSKKPASKKRPASRGLKRPIAARQSRRGAAASKGRRSSHGRAERRPASKK